MKTKKRAVRAAAAAALVLTLCVCAPANAAALDAEVLVPVGSTVGIQLRTEGIMVVGLAQVETGEGTACPAEDAGIRPGDMIVRLGQWDTATAAEFLTAVSRLDGAPVAVTALRDGETMQFNVTPAQAADGGWQLGLWLRDGVSGIGTVTFYDPKSGVFGALGHGINDIDTGELLPAGEGVITGASVVDVIRGVEGAPGELCGRFDKDKVLGSILKNTPCGIYGMYAQTEAEGAVPVAGEEEVHLGGATILANISGGDVEEYDIEISRIYHDSEDTRFLMLTVRDQRLLDATGGIVQGMSGSPILQDGKLIGAVTHVLVNDPTRGYGISIQDMLDAAG